jgi:hypothetical protein
MSLMSALEKIVETYLGRDLEIWEREGRGEKTLRW